MEYPILDLSHVLAAAVGPSGIDPDRLEEDGDLQRRFESALETVAAWKEEGRLGFLDLPYARDTSRRVAELAESFGQWFEDVVVLGIGGSGLGAIALREALLGPGWNERDDEERGYYPRLHVLDNPDPTTVDALLGRLDLRKTLFVVISKSGSTAETMAQYLVARERVGLVVDPESLRGHFLFITDPEKGVLRTIADAEGIPTLPVPDNVGGRFSVLSPVGLLPAAVCGIDIEALLDGAADMEARCRGTKLSENPAGALATVLHAADTELNRPIHVLMAYADRLSAFTLWFQQLWAESLGKMREDGPVGPTPLPAVGATDQHAQVQLFMEGPQDKIVVFLAVDPPAEDVTIPDLHPAEGALAYLAGHTLGELLDAERRATTEALRRGGRPSLTLELGSADARTIGALIMLFELATVQAGAMYGVDPLDQPGVELGKQLTYGLMGRAGYDAPSFHDGDPRWRISGVFG
ncbi:MAG: glucose-6-phosphate isomerase [Gemmatimonadetes bacterium]|nr:glucose-6-phosphate isomerase [Gemmatimonadota bacterium]